MSDRNRHRLRTIGIVLATVLVVAPAAALAGHQFNDVPDSNIFHDDIDWMRENQVTAGCNPPANDEYCPDDNVTREQMAAFMRRLDTKDVFVRPSDTTFVPSSQVVPFSIEFDGPGTQTVATSGALSLVAICEEGNLDSEADGTDQAVTLELRSTTNNWISAENGLLDASDTVEVALLEESDDSTAVADYGDSSGAARSAAGHYIGLDDYHVLQTLNHAGTTCTVSGAVITMGPPA